MITLKELILSGVPYCGEYDVPVTANFSLKEFVRNNHGIKVCASPSDMRCIFDLADCVLQPLRDLIQVPIIITSGLRNVELNNRVHGVPNSQHLYGKAVDIISKNIIKMWYTLIVKCEFDQAIIYIGENNVVLFIHVSYNWGDNRNQKLICQYTPFGKKYTPYTSKKLNKILPSIPR